jgi:hypothetical protein
MRHAEASSLIVKPLPADKFIVYGTNAEMRWKAMSGQVDRVPIDRFFVRNTEPIAPTPTCPEDNVSPTGNSQYNGAFRAFAGHAHGMPVKSIRHFFDSRIHPTYAPCGPATKRSPG